MKAVVCTLDEAILMSTHNKPLSIKTKKNEIIQNLHGMRFFLGTKEQVRNGHGNRASVLGPLKLYCKSTDMGLKIKDLC